MASPPADGLILAVFRLTFGGLLLIWTHVVYVPVLVHLERPASFIARRSAPTPSAEDVYWLGIDLYKLLMTFLTLAAYTLVWASQQAGCYGKLVAGMAGAFVLLRLVEYIATVGLYFFSRPPGESLVSFRPVANAFWSYGEIALIFGVLYAALGTIDPEAIMSSSCETPNDTYLGSLYFSFVTIATIGYGDFAPQANLARCLTMVESVVGLVLVVAIIQKALSRTP